MTAPSRGSKAKIAPFSPPSASVATCCASASSVVTTVLPARRLPCSWSTTEFSSLVVPDSSSLRDRSNPDSSPVSSFA